MTQPQIIKAANLGQILLGSLILVFQVVGLIKGLAFTMYYPEIIKNLRIDGVLIQKREKYLFRLFYSALNEKLLPL